MHGSLASSATLQSVKILAFDAHVSIVSDIRNIFESLGHSVDIASMSSHDWITESSLIGIQGLRRPGRVNSRLRTDWTRINDRMIERFYRLNKEKLKDYDVFVTSYPPAFALLFEKFEKPIIVISCTRFDFPCISDARREWLIDGLSRLNSRGLLFPIANNLLDTSLAEKYMPFAWKHVPSLCNYMNGSYEGSRSVSALWYRGSAELEEQIASTRGFDPSFSITRRYDRETIKSFRSVVHIPYQVSIMSAFEHYAQGIPMVVPSLKFLSKLYDSGIPVLSEILFPKSSLVLPEDWLSLADYYDHNNFKGLIYFDSWEEMGYHINESSLESVSLEMINHHKTRSGAITATWNSILEEML